ncbi:MAG: hypothetical protein Q8J76_10965 [Desulfobulbaceae bacterium]|nr:hypothetical protein [Desulfobulbaceae bacterium]
MLEELILKYSDIGFAYAVSLFLLWKGYKQDERFLTVMERLEAKIDLHTRQKDKALALLEKPKKKRK